MDIRHMTGIATFVTFAFLAAPGCSKEDTPAAKPTVKAPKPTTVSGLTPVTGALPPLTAPTFAPTALFPADLVADAGFGSALDLDGSVLVVGVPGRLFSEHVVGSAQVFERQDKAWKRTASLTGAAGAKRFGHAVAVSKDTIAVAAAYGQVSIFGRKNKTWSEAAKIQLPASGSLYSVSLALDGDTLAVGIEDWNVGGALNSGVVVIYERSDGSWPERARLYASDTVKQAAAQPNFGWRVALEGDRLVASSRQAHCGRVEMCGAAYVFERAGGAGGAWTEKLKLPNHDLVRWAGLARSVASQGPLMVLSCPGERRAWVLERSNDGWHDAGSLDALTADPADPADTPTFGGAVTAYGRFAAVSILPKASSFVPPTLPGTQEIDTAALGRQRASSGGTVQLYVRQSDGWKPGATFTRPADGAGDELGDSLVMGDGVLVASAPGAHGGRGEVMIYQTATP